MGQSKLDSRKHEPSLLSPLAVFVFWTVLASFLTFGCSNSNDTAVEVSSNAPQTGASKEQPAYAPGVTPEIVLPPATNTDETEESRTDARMQQEASNTQPKSPTEMRDLSSYREGELTRSIVVFDVPESWYGADAHVCTKTESSWDTCMPLRLASKESGPVPLMGYTASDENTVVVLAKTTEDALNGEFVVLAKVAHREYNSARIDLTVDPNTKTTPADLLENGAKVPTIERSNGS